MAYSYELPVPPYGSPDGSTFWQDVTAAFRADIEERDRHWAMTGEPLDLDAIQARVRSAYRGPSEHESLSGAIADVQALLDEMRRLREYVAIAEMRVFRGEQS